MDGLMPITTTATQLQRNYRNVVKKAKKNKKPIIVLYNNKPEGVYIDYATFKNEFIEASVSKKAKKAGFAEFSGIWTKEEAEKFDRIIEDAFEQVNPEDWQ